MNTKLENLVVINKQELEKRLKDIEDQYFKVKHEGGSDAEYLDVARTYLKEVIQSSKPLKPFIEKAFDAGILLEGCISRFGDSTLAEDKQDYLNKEIEW